MPANGVWNVSSNADDYDGDDDDDDDAVRADAVDADAAAADAAGRGSCPIVRSYPGTGVFADDASRRIRRRP